MAVADRVRAHLDDLARKAAIDRASDRLRLDPEAEKRERGFHVHFSGANSDFSGPPGFRARKPPLLRVAGALPVPRGPKLAEPPAAAPPRAAEQQPNRVRPAPSGAAARLPTPTPAALPVQAAAQAAPRRARRRWDVGQPVTLMTSEGEYLYMPPARTAGQADSAREEHQQPPPAPPLRSVASTGDLAEPAAAAAAPASPSRSEPGTPTIPETCAEEEQGGDDEQVLRLLRGDAGETAAGDDGAAPVAAGVRDSGCCADVGTGMD
mmetsp:Transcript_13873/g.36408  ORF Transcript_13873/g.36408 Transcript_13873/m.36408 type:complete len:265 (-) Transcript_13873:60-854(-)